MSSLNDKHVVSIKMNDEQRTVLTFDDGTVMELDGKSVPLPEASGVPQCAFCGTPPGGDTPLYTVDGTVFICKNCIIDAFETLLKNGVTMPLHCVALSKLANITGKS